MAKVGLAWETWSRALGARAYSQLPKVTLASSMMAKRWPTTGARQRVALPEPIMDKVVATKNRDLFPTWTQKLWPQDPTRPVPYKAGRGYTRRPDVVIVKDPTKPPTQDNIKQVVEMKFPGDPYGQGQREEYIRIAGDRSKMVPLELKDCDCNQPEPEKSKVPVEQLGTAGAILSLLYMVLMKRPPPRGVPAF